MESIIKRRLPVSNSTRRLLCATVIALVSLGASFASAQDYPSKPIRLIVPYPPGGATDQMARIIQSPIAEILGQPIVVENKPGAAGAIGVELAARSTPDGYTLVFANSGNTVAAVVKKLSYDPIRDFQPISAVATFPLVLAVTKSLSTNSVKELIDLVRSRPGLINYASTGLGGFSHLTSEYFNSLAGIKSTHIPYKGGAPALIALRTGEVQMMFVTPVDGAVHVRAGEIRYLGVSSPRPTGLLPGLPAVAETVPGFNSVVWFGVLTPSGTPQVAIDKLHAAVSRAIEHPAVKDGFKVLQVEPTSNTPEQFREMMSGELAQWSKVVKDLNLKFD
jgi:tripartite-type tricarboxylate transporter receptor subunit TctC